MNEEEKPVKKPEEKKEYTPKEESEPSKVAQIIGTAILMVITLLIVWLLLSRYCGL